MFIRRYGGKEPARERGHQTILCMDETEGISVQEKVNEEEKWGGTLTPPAPQPHCRVVARPVEPPRSFKPSGPFHLVVLLFDLVGLVYIQRLVVRLFNLASL